MIIVFTKILLISRGTYDETIDISSNFQMLQFIVSHAYFILFKLINITFGFTYRPSHNYPPPPPPYF